MPVGTDPAPPRRGDLDIWLALDPTLHAWAWRRRGVLSSSERRRAARFATQAGRAEFVLGKVLLRYTLARYLGQPPGRIEIETGAHGKPRLAVGAPADLRFNVSHAGGAVAVACAMETDVGIDIERTDQRLELDLLAPRVLSSAERALLDAAPPEKRTLVFLTMWTRKEAVAKAWGVGIATDLRELDVTGSVVRANGTAWWLSELRLPSGLVGACASAERSLRVSFQGPAWAPRDAPPATGARGARPASAGCSES